MCKDPPVMKMCYDPKAFSKENYVVGCQTGNLVPVQTADSGLRKEYEEECHLLEPLARNVIPLTTSLFDVHYVT